ncbi:MAG: winged helix-turn-helix transcriptional regulator [Ignavibacteria bacterium]|nr:winged helix-turn-helix transcriptional regulator [Ignavibacteria bacterium]
MSNTNSVFSALADENRRKIIVMLSRESMNVNAIAEKFRISRPAISKHLRILENSKLVSQVKEGRERYYSFNPKQMNAAIDWFKFYDMFWDNKLNALKKFIEKTQGS